MLHPEDWTQRSDSKKMNKNYGLTKEDEEEVRRGTVRNALGISALGGHGDPSPHTMELMERYIKGEIGAEELQDLIHKHILQSIEKGSL